MRPTVEIRGLNRLNQKLEAITQALSGDGLKDEATEYAELMQTEWKDRVRIYAYKSGDYWRSIHVVSVSAGRSYVTLEVVADAEHARFVEYGTRHMAARPLMRQAARQARRAILRHATDSVRVRIRRAIK